MQSGRNGLSRVKVELGATLRRLKNRLLGLSTKKLAANLARYLENSQKSLIVAKVFKIAKEQITEQLIFFTNHKNQPTTPSYVQIVNLTDQ